ncbi:FecR domain-containing protein [Pedobacter sp. MC2016-14]|uniref:FecR family protein n=1 Tax=Pedobacter sp. MC2016-14 TaxID=2897327 RepID=UPI001E455F8C|nr:FecR domain-containing protein [Pedobacter sp. MC2016-14]MCD0488270.1 FecR domain-containing protein [Pedobacter sp. MC2016-14]
MNQNNIERALRISSLVKRYLNETLSEQERQELDQWFMQHPQERKDVQNLLQQKLRDYSPDASKKYGLEQSYAQLISRISDKELRTSKPPTSFRTFYQFAAAAAVVIIVSIGMLLFRRQNYTYLEANSGATKFQTARAKGVELTLTNGKKFNLEIQNAGVIASEQQAVITKQKGNVLSYQSTQAPQEENSNALNTLTIPRGKQYQIVLPDGSKVWLNAQSTLSFPNNFNKNERLVSLVGEGYFEVNHFSAWPFRVKTQHQQVEVLGTVFNISAYNDDSQGVTTLVTGSVKVSDQKKSQLLKPGQLAVKVNSAVGFSIEEADIAEATDWKNGKLVFKDEKIESLTQTLSRTFDVDFDIDERIKGQHFSGNFSIKNGLNNVLRNLEQTGAIYFKVNGRRISVMP